jgi:hypothetical protein
MSHRISKEGYAPPITHKDGSSSHVLLLDVFVHDFYEGVEVFDFDSQKDISNAFNFSSARLAS